MLSRMGQRVDDPDGEQTAEQAAERIRIETGLGAYTEAAFGDSTVWWFFRNTGIPTSFGMTILLGFIVGVAVAGQTFYSFVLENLKYFAAIKAMGADQLKTVEFSGAGTTCTVAPSTAFCAQSHTWMSSVALSDAGAAATGSGNRSRILRISTAPPTNTAARPANTITTCSRGNDRPGMGTTSPFSTVAACAKVWARNRTQPMDTARKVRITHPGRVQLALAHEGTGTMRPAASKAP